MRRRDHGQGEEEARRSQAPGGKEGGSAEALVDETATVKEESGAKKESHIKDETRAPCSAGSAGQDCSLWSAGRIGRIGAGGSRHVTSRTCRGRSRGPGRGPHDGIEP